MGGEILRRAAKNIERRLKRARRILLFLDCDGTLTPIKRKPHLARLDKKTKTLLRKLARKVWFKVFIVSGRSLKDIKRLIGVKALYYIGNHGLELEGPGLKYINPDAKVLKPFIQKCHSALKKKLRLKGVLLENKIYTLSLHYRLVDSRKIPTLKEAFTTTIRDLQKDKKIRITEGKKVFEIQPNIKWDKGEIVNWVLKRTKEKDALPICIGDDQTDEDAFEALGKKGISILVSKQRRKTFAQYRVNSPKDVIRFLEYIELGKQ